MPSLPHEILVELFQTCPDLARELLHRCAGIELRGVAEAKSAELTQIVPTEYRADGVIVHREGDRTTAAVIVEVQRGIDADKQWAWPLYVAALRAKERCAVFLLVFATDDAVARWARTPIALGHPGHVLEPIVISYRDVPAVRDAAVALRYPQLVVLSALARRTLDLGTLAADAIRGLPDDRAGVYLDLLLEEVPGLRDFLEADMKSPRYEYRSEFARKYYSQGLEAGLEAGLETLRVSVLDVARAKLKDLAATDEARIRALTDAEQLRHLNLALAGATSPGDARRALDATIGANTNTTTKPPATES